MCCSATTFSDLAQCEGEEDEEILAQILLGLKERPETPDSCQDSAGVSFRSAKILI